MYSITRKGKALDTSLYTIDKKTKTFSSNEDNLVLDFSDEFGWTFNTGYSCTFNTGHDCTFKTGSYCTFNTGAYCTFNTGSRCVVVRREVYEVIELDGTKKIKLNDWNVKGYTVIKDEKVDTLVGTEVEVKIGNKTYKAVIK